MPQTLTTRRASLALGSFNLETRTFTAVAATATPVPRFDYFEGKAFNEVLSITAKAIRLDRLNSGRAPLLDSHRTETMKDQIGVVTNARVEGGQLLVDIQLSSRPDIQPIADDLAAGVIRNVSIGYRPHRSEEHKAADGTRTVTHVDWEPYEVSLVTIPADGNAYVRSHEGDYSMDPELDDTTLQSPPEPVTRNVSQRITRAERERITVIRNMGGRFGFKPEEIEDAINTGEPLEDFRDRAFARKAAEAEKTRASAINSGGYNDGNPLEEAIQGALYARMTGKTPEGYAREWAGRSLLDMGAALLEARGERVSWSSRERLATQIMTRSGYHSTSDFPVLLSMSGNRVLQDAYQAAQSPLKQFARRRNTADFRSLTKVKLSEAPRLLKVGEGGEVEYGSRSEEKESFKIETFARIFSISRQAIINDDLGAFADSAQAWGRAAAETEADLLVALFTANGGDGVAMDDGNPVYSTARKNKAAAGAALSITSLGDARQAMREMKGLDGVTPIGVTPKHLVVSPAKETAAEQVLAQIAAAQVDNANPFSGKLALHVEPRFTGNEWRLFADPSELATIEIAYLNGQEAPILDVQEGWSTLGAEFRAVLDFGCGITEHRGTYLNPGA